jgi:UDP:flavonoid glycosyltransferase YjiC (YdhE family)
MRVLITMFPSPPHYYPIVPLARAGVRAGHEVRVVSMPNMAGVVTRSGLPAVPVGPDPAEVSRRADITAAPPRGGTPLWPEDWPGYPERLSAAQRATFRPIARCASALARAHLADLIAYGRDWGADLIVHDSAQFAGPVAASALGIPNARYLLGHPGRMRVDTCYGTEPVPEYLALFEEFGAPVRIEPTAWLDPCPPTLQYPHPAGTTVLPVRYVPYNGTDPLTVPATERPRVCLTWGHTAPDRDGTAILDLIRRTAAALGELDVEPVLALRPSMADRLGGLPDGVRVEVAAPLHALLPTCSAVIHHAGPGSTMTAAACGVPQLTITNQPHNAALADRVAAAGAGIHTPLAEAVASVDGIRDDVAALLGKPSYGEAAQALREEIAAQPAPSEVVRRLV